MFVAVLERTERDAFDVQTPTESWKILWQVEKYFLKNKQVFLLPEKNPSFFSWWFLSNIQKVKKIPVPFLIAGIR